MVIKPQDVVVLTKLIAQPNAKDWSQNRLAFELCLSPSQINAALKRLVTAGLLTPYRSPGKPEPILQASEEFLIHGVKYIFPAKLGEMVRGIPTSYCGPRLKKSITTGKELGPVWPYGEGNTRGVALKPLYPSVPRAISEHPDTLFYDLLTLIDAIRSGRAREKQIAIQELVTILHAKNDE